MIIFNLVLLTILPALVVLWFKDGLKTASWLGVISIALNFLAVLIELLNLGGNYV